MEETTETTPTLYQHAAKWGMIMAGVSIFLTVLFYIVDYTVLITLKYLLLLILIYLSVVIFAGINYRKSIGGYLSYGQAFLNGFIILAVAGLIGTVFNLILYYVIDPELPQKLIDASIENTREIMEKFGVSGDQADEALEKAKTEASKKLSITGQAMGYVWLLVISAVVSAITSLFVRKNQPEVI